MTGKLQPLSSNFAIVDENGFPTPYFIQWAQERQIDIVNGIDAEQAQALIDDWAAARHVDTGHGLTGGGTLDHDLTIALDAGLGDLNDVDLTTPPTSGQTIVYDSVEMKFKPGAGSGGGGSASGPPTVRGGGQISGNAALYDVPIDPSCRLGDMCVIFGAHGYDIIVPVGWTTLDNSTGAAANGAVFYKILAGADIIAGHITVTTTAAYDGSFFAVVFVGPTAGVTLGQAVRYGAGGSGSNETVLTTGPMTINDLEVTFGSNRGTNPLVLTLANALVAITTSFYSRLGTYQPSTNFTGTEHVFFTDDTQGSYCATLVVHGIVFVEEAPDDGQYYARKNDAWASFTPGGGGGGAFGEFAYNDPLASAFTLLLGGAGSTGSLTDFSGKGLGVQVNANGAGGRSAFAYQAAPATPYTVTARLNSFASLGNGELITGLMLRNSGSGKAIMIFRYQDQNIYFQTFADMNGGGGGTVTGPNMMNFFHPPAALYFAVNVDVAGNVIFYYSADGAFWEVLTNTTLATFIGAADQIGVFIACSVGAFRGNLLVPYYRVDNVNPPAPAL